MTGPADPATPVWVIRVVLKHLAATSAIALNADIRLRRNICRNGPEADMTMERAFSTLRPHNATRMFSTENVVVEVRNPLLTRNGGVKVCRGCI